MQVEGQRDTSVLPATGGRVRNAHAIYFTLGNSLRKRELIPHIILLAHVKKMKAPAV